MGAVELSIDESILLWEIDCNADDDKAPVSHIKVAPLKENANANIILVRDDSTIEIYKFSLGQANIMSTSFKIGQKMAFLVFQKKIEGDSVTGIAVGNVTNSVRREVLISCYSGAIRTLVDKKHAKKLGTLTEDASALTDAQIKKEKQQKLAALT